MICATSDPNLLRLLFARHQQNGRLKHYLQVIGKMSEYILQAVGQGGVGRAEFSTDVTFSLFFNECLFIITIVVVFIRIQPCRAKYRGIWAILMHKMIFRLKVAILFQRVIPSVFLYRGNFLPAYPLNRFAYPWGTEVID